jgi:hypothetical protein
MSTRRFFEPAFDGIGATNVVVGGDRVGSELRSESCACGFASGDVYNEEAFRYFLEVERKRSELSNRPLVLLLLDLNRPSPHAGDIDTATAQKLFAALSVCVRETDFVGWYRAHSVAGAVLTQHSDTAGADLQELVSRRISQLLSERLPSELAGLVRVRVHQLPSAVQIAI